jgi:hypothetical protein
MTNIRLTTRTGLAAIAAVLALPATSALAQDAAPASSDAIAAPSAPIAPPTADASIAVPKPAIVLPDAAPVTAESARDETHATAAASPRRTAARGAPTRAEPVRAPAALAAPTLAAPVVNESAPASESLSARTVPSAAPVVRPYREPADRTELLAEILAGLLVAGLGAGAIAMLLRRRRVAEPERIVVRDRAAETVVEPATAESAPDYVSAPAIATDGGLPNDGAAIALPRQAPTDFETRSSLLRRMIEARPDRANPFTAPQARAKRARLILASLGRKFENARPRIDLSQYPNNWPALAQRNRPAFG